MNNKVYLKPQIKLAPLPMERFTTSTDSWLAKMPTVSSRCQVASILLMVRSILSKNDYNHE